MYLSGFRKTYLREHKKRLTAEALPTPPPQVLRGLRAVPTLSGLAHPAVECFSLSS